MSNISPRMLNEIFIELNEKLKFKSYHRKRFIFIIDRRKDKYSLINYYPENYCNTIPQKHVPEVYFQLSRNCILPESKKEKLKRIAIHEDVGGMNFCLSFHIESMDNIKCYLWKHGGCIRFFPKVKKIIFIFFCFFIKFLIFLIFFQTQIFYLLL